MDDGWNFVIVAFFFGFNEFSDGVCHNFSLKVSRSIIRLCLCWSALLLVLDKAAGIDVGLATLGARVLQFTRTILVDLRVLAQIASSGELFGAKFTLIRLFAGVCLFMSLEVGTLNETLSTDTADIWTFVSVDSLVFNQRRKVIKVTRARI